MAVTHPSTNPARLGLTSVIRENQCFPGGMVADRWAVHNCIFIATALPARLTNKSLGTHRTPTASTSCFTDYYVLIRVLHFHRGRARTQVPTTRNYTLELPTFGVIAGVNPIEVQ